MGLCVTHIAIIGAGCGAITINAFGVGWKRGIRLSEHSQGSRILSIKMITVEPLLVCLTSATVAGPRLRRGRGV